MRRLCSSVGKAVRSGSLQGASRPALNHVAAPVVGGSWYGGKVWLQGTPGGAAGMGETGHALSTRSFTRSERDPGQGFMAAVRVSGTRS